jgi:hypothetical protein
MFVRLTNCAHCGASITEKRRFRFCSLVCEEEHKRDLVPSIQRINSLQILADAEGAWLRLDNFSLYLLADESRRVRVVERLAPINSKPSFYRITVAGRRLLRHWKAVMEVSA